MDSGVFNGHGGVPTRILSVVQQLVFFFFFGTYPLLKKVIIEEHHSWNRRYFKRPKWCLSSTALNTSIDILLPLREGVGV